MRLLDFIFHVLSAIAFILHDILQVALYLKIPMLLKVENLSLVGIAGLKV